jgi:hypothetical protein
VDYPAAEGLGLLLLGESHLDHVGEEQFMVGEEIWRAVVSVHFQEETISEWTKTASDHTTIVQYTYTSSKYLT